MTTPTPSQLHQLDTATLGISWDDAHQSAYNVRDLRLACRCALCVDEYTGAPKLNPTTVSQTVKPVAIKPVGNYALHVSWSDGHTTGFYRFDYLRRICQCATCAPDTQRLSVPAATAAAAAQPQPAAPKRGCGSGCGCTH